jgi:hypothetical protein
MGTKGFLRGNGSKRKVTGVVLKRLMRKGAEEEAEFKAETIEDTENEPQ